MNTTVEVELGSQLVLTSNITEFNLDINNITWTKNDDVITNGTNGFSILLMGLDAPPSVIVLVQDSITSPAQDSGLLTLYVSNPAGASTSSFNVTVTG